MRRASPWRTEWMLWSMVHGYAMLLIEGQIRRQRGRHAAFHRAWTRSCPPSAYRPEAQLAKFVDTQRPGRGPGRSSA
jgi:hypothetical protein